MSIRKDHRAARICACLLAYGLTAMPGAHAQFAVIDVASVTQLIAQARTLQDQLSTARDHLERAQEQLQSMQGTRGMDELLSGTMRNYLPSDWAQLQRLLSGGTPEFVALSSGLRQAIEDNALLTDAYLSTLGAEQRESIAAARRSAALLQVLTQEALATTSDRFASVQLLIDAIRAAPDQKAILDLQARIAAEQGMLQNEHNKLTVLYQATRARERAEQQRLRERVIAGHGRFEERFQPAP